MEAEIDSKSVRRVASNILVRDEPLKPTERFWTRLHARYGFHKSFFRYFEHGDQSEMLKNVSPNVSVMLFRNGGNFDFDDRWWMLSEKTGKLI